MSNDMKLIMENWRKNVLSESDIKTYGDLKQALQGALKFKKGLSTRFSFLIFLLITV